jgi:hypothetical protein
MMLLFSTLMGGPIGAKGQRLEHTMNAQAQAAEMRIAGATKTEASPALRLRA